MAKSKFLAVGQYQVYRSWQYTVMLGLILVFNLILGIIFKKTGITGGSTDIITFIFAPILGMELFRVVFRFSIFNGSSRKTYLLSSLLTILLTSAAWSVMTGIIIIISKEFATNIIIFPMIFSDGLVAMFSWIFAVSLALISFGWLVSILFNVLSKNAKLIIMFIGIIIGTIFSLLNVYVNSFTSFVGKMFGLLLGITGNFVSAYLSAVMFFILATVIVLFNWLLLRRMEIK